MAMLREGKLSNWIGYALEYIQADQPVTHMIEADSRVHETRRYNSGICLPGSRVKNETGTQLVPGLIRPEPSQAAWLTAPRILGEGQRLRIWENARR